MGYVSTGMGYRFIAQLVSLMTLRLMLVDRNPFRPCFQTMSQLITDVYTYILEKALSCNDKRSNTALIHPVL